MHYCIMSPGSKSKPTVKYGVICIALIENHSGSYVWYISGKLMLSFITLVQIIAKANRHKANVTE